MNDRIIPDHSCAWDESLEREEFLSQSKDWGPHWGGFIRHHGKQFGVWGKSAKDGPCYGYAEVSSCFFWLTMMGRLSEGIQEYSRIMALARFEKKGSSIGISFTTDDASSVITKFLKRINIYHENQIHLRGAALDREEFGKEFGRVVLHSQIGVYSHSDLQKYLQCLTEKLHGQPFELFLDSGSHVSNICFCPTNKEWLFFDFNNQALEIFDGEDSDNLSKKIMEKLYGDEGFVIFRTEIRCGLLYESSLRKKIHTLCNEEKWNNIHKFNRSKANALNRHGIGALYIASRDGDSKFVSDLLCFGAVANAATKDNGFTPLYIASELGHEDVVSRLLENGAFVNIATTRGRSTALHNASLNGHSNVVRILLANGASVNAKTQYGHTALHCASHRKHTEVVRILSNASAEQADNKPFQKDRYDKTVNRSQTSMGLWATDKSSEKSILKAHAKADSEGKVTMNLGLNSKYE